MTSPRSIKARSSSLNDRRPATIPLPGFLLSVLAASLLSACAVVPEEASGPAAVDMAPEAPPDVLRAPTDEDVIYNVFAGEYLGSEGDLLGAVDRYLQAAMSSADPAVAQRATRIAFAAESWHQAAMAADRWGVLDPESIPAHESAANAMLRAGDHFGAEYQLLAILEILQDSQDAWTLVARIIANSGDPQNADQLFEHLMQERGAANPTYVYSARSQLSAMIRRLEKAFEYARRAVELDPENTEYLTWAGRVALNLELKDTGIEYIRRAWELDPDNHDLTLAYADLLARNGEEEEARRVMQEMKQTPDVLLSRILFELSAKNRSGAMALFDEFSGLDWEDSSEKAFYQAQAAEALGMSRQAIAYYARVTEGDRALASALRRAELIALDGDMNAARAELAEMRANGDGTTVEQAWLTEARILREAGDREAGFDVLDQAVLEMPASTAVRYSRALLAAELGWVDVAEKDLRTIIASQPENVAALNALGYTLADQTERYEEAEQLIRQAYILQPNEASIVDSMGWVAYRQGRLEEAAEFLAKAWSLDRNVEIAAHLGEVLWMMGRGEQALEIFREGAAADADNAVLQETLERLGIKL